MYLSSLQVNIAPGSVRSASATVRFYISTLTKLLIHFLQDFIHPPPIPIPKTLMSSKLTMNDQILGHTEYKIHLLSDLRVYWIRAAFLLRSLVFDPNLQSLLKGTDLGNAPARVNNTNLVCFEYRGLGWYYEHDHRVCWYFEHDHRVCWYFDRAVGILK